VRYFRRKLTYEFLDEIYEEEAISFNCLQFDYSFEVDWEEVHFAYAPPYSFSDLARTISTLKTAAAPP
jgi:hypothetical protein